MSRRNRTIIVLGVAVAMAALASLGVYAAIQRVPVREVEVAHRFVVVASRAVAVGTLLTNDHVKLVAWPEKALVPGSFADVDAVVGRGVLVSVLEHEPLTESKLAPRDAGAGLPPTITTGMRAISIKVNEVIGVAGFVVPGTRVDVVAVVNERGKESVSRVVVSNVRVLTAGTRYDQEKTKDGKPMPSTVVTLMVTPQDAERVALAATEGKIVLALRNPLDTDLTDTVGVPLSALMRQPIASARPANPNATRPTPPSEKTASAPPPPGPYMVEAIRAAKRTQEVVQ